MANVTRSKLLGGLTLGGREGIQRVGNQLAGDYCQITNSANQSIGNDVVTTLAFNSLSTPESGAGLATLGSPGNIKVKVDGLYILGGNVNWATNAAGNRGVYISVNASVIAGNAIPPIGAWQPDQSVCTMSYLKTGDQVTMAVWQTSGGLVSVVNLPGPRSPTLWVAMLR